LFPDRGPNSLNFNAAPIERCTAKDYQIQLYRRADVPITESKDNYGNFCQRLVAPPGEFIIHTSAEVITAENIDSAPGACFVEIQNLPNQALP
jgi:hypothetical protein